MSPQRSFDGICVPTATPYCWVLQRKPLFYIRALRGRRQYAWGVVRWTGSSLAMAKRLGRFLSILWCKVFAMASCAAITTFGARGWRIGRQLKPLQACGAHPSCPRLLSRVQLWPSNHPLLTNHPIWLRRQLSHHLRKPKIRRGG